MSNVEQLKKSPRQLAEEELAAENANKAKNAIKAKLIQRQQAQLVLDNIDREIKDLEKQVADGDFGK